MIFTFLLVLLPDIEIVFDALLISLNLENNFFEIEMSVLKKNDVFLRSSGCFIWMLGLKAQNKKWLKDFQ